MQDSNSEKKEFDSLNLFSSQAIEIILVSLRKIPSLEALTLLEKEEVILCEKIYLERFRAHLTQFQQNQAELKSIIDEVKSERDMLLGSVHHFYKTFSFVFEAIKQAKKGDSKPSTTSRLIGIVIRRMNMGDMDKQTMVIIEEVIKRVIGNIPAITENLQNAAPQLEPSLHILFKHNIIDKSIIDITNE